MKTAMRIALILMLGLIGLLVVLPAFAQATPMTILDAIAALKAAQGDNLKVVKVEMNDAYNAAGQEVTCWYFVTDMGDFCVSLADASVFAPVLYPTPETTPDASPMPEVTPEPTAPLTLSQLEVAIMKAQSVYPNTIVTEVNLKVGRTTGVVVWEVEFGDDREVKVNAETGDIVDFGHGDDDDNDDDMYDDDHSDTSGHDDSDDDSAGHGSDDDDDDNSGHDSDDDADNDDNSGHGTDADNDDNSGHDSDDDDD